MVESTSNTSTICKGSKIGGEESQPDCCSVPTVVTMRDKHSCEGHNRPHSVAEWSPSRTISSTTQRRSKVTFIDERLSQTPVGTKRAANLPQFTSDQIQHWLSLEDFSRTSSADSHVFNAKGQRPLTTTSLTALNGTPPVKPARRIGTICESELETEEILESKTPTNDLDVLRSFSKPQMYKNLPKSLIPAYKWETSRKPTRIQTVVGLQSPSRRDRPTSLQLVTTEDSVCRTKPHETDL